MPTQQDYYEILGVSKNATEDEIKRAYRNLARKAHPDVVDDVDKRHAEVRFKQINEAYAVLSDPSKRAHYDRFGSADGFGAGGFGSGFGATGMGDIFDFFFGGGTQRTRGPARGSDLRYDLEVQLVEVLSGAEKQIAFTHLARCEVCKGSGSASGQEPISCQDCNGTGELRHARNTMLGQFVTTAPCVRCGGSGKIVRDPCKNCHGRGRAEQRRTLTVKVPAGAQDGTRIRYTGMGEAGERGGPSGDLYIYVAVAPHEVFARDGADLHCQTAVSFTQAAMGATLEIEALDGNAQVKIPGGTQTGTSFRIAGRGLPKLRGHGRGDLIVEVQIVVPTKLTRKQREILEEFARAGGEEVEDRDLFTKVRKAFAAD